MKPETTVQEHDTSDLAPELKLMNSTAGTAGTAGTVGTVGTRSLDRLAAKARR